MILAGRRLNDGMGEYVVSVSKSMLKYSLEGSNVLIMGLTFKENCPDIRNTKVIDIIKELQQYNINVDITDPWCCNEDAKKDYGLALVNEPKNHSYDAIIVAVAHDHFKEMGVEKIRELGKEKHVIYDLKYILPKDMVDMRL